MYAYDAMEAGVPQIIFDSDKIPGDQDILALSSDLMLGKTVEEHEKFVAKLLLHRFYYRSIEILKLPAWDMNLPVRPTLAHYSTCFGSRYFSDF